MAEAATTGKKKQVRIASWGTPRSLSTALFRAMWNRKSCKCLPEPYGFAWFFGPDRGGKWFRDVEAIDGCHYPDIKRELYEGQYDEEVVFAKDFPAYIYRQKIYKPEDLVPSGYTHTFLLRSPRDCVASAYKIFLKKEINGFDEWDPDFISFKQLWQFYNVVAAVQPNPLVIHADDLVAYPEATLRLFCERVGIEFEESMLNWNESDGMNDKLCSVMPFLKVFFDTVLTTKGISGQASQRSQVQLPPEVEKELPEHEEYYAKLMQFVTRVTPPAPAQQ